MVHFLVQICLFSDPSGSDGVWSLLLRQVFGFILDACRGLGLPGGEGHFTFSSDFGSCVPAGYGSGLGHWFSPSSSTDQSQSCFACCLSIAVPSGALKPLLAQGSI